MLKAAVLTMRHRRRTWKTARAWYAGLERYAGKQAPRRLSGEIPSSERGDSIIVIRGVPGWICDSCGEAYHESVVSERLLALARSATRRGAEVEILRYSASNGGASSVAA